MIASGRSSTRIAIPPGTLKSTKSEPLDLGLLTVLVQYGILRITQMEGQQAQSRGEWWKMGRAVVKQGGWWNAGWGGREEGVVGGRRGLYG